MFKVSTIGCVTLGALWFSYNYGKGCELGRVAKSTGDVKATIRWLKDQNDFKQKFIGIIADREMNKRDR